MESLSDQGTICCFGTIETIPPVERSPWESFL